MRALVGAQDVVLCPETARFARFVRFGTVKPLETVEIVELCDDLRFFGTV